MSVPVCVCVCVRGRGRGRQRSSFVDTPLPSSGQSNARLMANPFSCNAGRWINRRAAHIRGRWELAARLGPNHSFSSGPCSCLRLVIASQSSGAQRWVGVAPKLTLQARMTPLARRRQRKQQSRQSPQESVESHGPAGTGHGQDSESMREAISD